MYNPGKLTKSGLLVHVVTESTSGYIGNLDDGDIRWKFRIVKG
jgi:hypothetical protein